MNFIKVSKDDGIATLVFSRNKVNAINEELIKQLQKTLIELENDPEVQALIITGENKFFSFGFDIPDFLSHSKEKFTDFLVHFTNLYTYLFTYSKPVVAAINGHAIAGGCMLALACDKRIMADGKAKISLNEITFGSSVFAGSVEMLKFCTGSRIAAEILYTGSMYSAKEALALNLIDETTSEGGLNILAIRHTRELCEKPAGAFSDLKKLLRTPFAEEMKKREAESIKNFVDIWYSDSTFENLKKIIIY